jgi:membrane fusion protein (multidrug efflux system)
VATDSLGNNWIVTQGLANGDQIMVTGVQMVREGAPVKPVAWQPPAAASGTAAIAAASTTPAASAASSPAAASVSTASAASAGLAQ